MTKEILKWLYQRGAKLISAQDDARYWCFEMPDGMHYSYEYLSTHSAEELEQEHKRYLDLQIRDAERS